MALIRTLERSCLRPGSAIWFGGIKHGLGAPVLCAKSHTDTIGNAQKDMKSHWIKNETVSRPISPHLTIWKWQLPMNMSLGHRITGCAMTTTLYVFGFTICALPGDYAMYLNVIKDWSLGPAMITSAKFILSFPVAYHALNGMRHLSWDFGKGLELKTIYTTGWAVLFSSIVLAGLMTQM